jgi:lysophospholipase L1-like esterase
VVDFARHVCPTGEPCSPQRDGIHPRPRDGIHFSAQGSAWAAEWLWPRLLAIWPEPASSTSSAHR